MRLDLFVNLMYESNCNMCVSKHNNLFYAKKTRASKTSTNTRHIKLNTSLPFLLLRQTSTVRQFNSQLAAVKCYQHDESASSPRWTERCYNTPDAQSRQTMSLDVTQTL